MKTSSSAGAKLAGFTLVVAVVFAATFGVARAVAPDSATGSAGEAHSEHAGHATATAPGLAVAEAGYRLVAESTTVGPGPAVPFRFRIVGSNGQAVQRYEQLHERQLHLIVVRRDLTGFQHVHPTREPDGTWATPLDLQAGGTWRAFADFAPKGGPAQLTLGVDLQVPGAFTPQSGPAAVTPPDPSLDVSFNRRGDDMSISVRRDGVPIEPEPYLGARGHLVALRAGDLAYLHVHPQDGGRPNVRFTMTLPTKGTYALFFDYQVDGIVHTAVTTVEAS